LVVVSGGKNNISKNKSENGVVHISNFVKQGKQANIIIMSTPKIHLSTTSCVNVEVTTYNRELHKRMKIFEYVNILESEVQKEHFTRHGLHMNTVRKELMAQRITDHFRKILLIRQKTPPIILKLRQVLMDSSQEVAEAQEKETYSSTPGRKRKQPATRGDEFCGEQI
jgi:hypothetical protein